MKRIALCVTAWSVLAGAICAQNRDFHIFIALGQSNMEGFARPEHQDSVGMDDRLVMMPAVDMPLSGREKGSWYPALPPICRDHTGLSPVDYFGRTMLAYLPEGHRVGVINVAVGGIKIEGFMKDSVESYINKQAPDNLHFNAAGYREFGRRYAFEMLKIMGIDARQVSLDRDGYLGAFSGAIFLRPGEDCTKIYDGAFADAAKFNKDVHVLFWKYQRGQPLN